MIVSIAKANWGNELSMREEKGIGDKEVFIRLEKRRDGEVFQRTNGLDARP